MKVTEPDVHDGSLFNRPLLPINEESGFAFAGDVRALENPVLTSLQVVMVREVGVRCVCACVNTLI
jgi:hypothetical protein